MKVTPIKGAWTYCIRIRLSDVRDYFRHCWNNIYVEIDDKFYNFNLTPTFWTTCPEFRGGPITDWLRTQGLLTWSYRQPPQFDLIHICDNKFRLLRNRQ